MTASGITAAPPDLPDEKLTLWTKLAYGSGDLGTAIVAAFTAFFLLIFLTDVARIAPDPMQWIVPLAALAGAGAAAAYLIPWAIQ